MEYPSPGIPGACAMYDAEVVSGASLPVVLGRSRISFAWIKKWSGSIAPARGALDEPRRGTRPDYLRLRDAFQMARNKIGSTKNKDRKRAPPARMASMSMHKATAIKKRQPLAADSIAIITSTPLAALVLILCGNKCGQDTRKCALRLGQYHVEVDDHCLFV